MSYSNINFLSPLEQFAISPILAPLSVYGIDFVLTNAALYLFSVFITQGFLMYFAFRHQSIIPSSWNVIFDNIYNFIGSLVKNQTGKNFLRFVPLLFTVFIFILTANLIGLFPWGYATTGHLIITFTIAISFNIGFLLLGFQTQGIRFLGLFAPAGVPLVFKPLIIIIEIVSYLLRTFSLSIRLFANMMAGHTLLHILASFCLVGGFIFSMVPWILVLGTAFLEIAIAFIQAYVFTILLAIYANDAINGSKH
jgi:ATP synthase subunit 6